MTASPFRLDGRAAAVTGAASGIGRATAEALAAAGAFVVVADLDLPGALDVAAGINTGGGRAVADAIERAGFDTLTRRPTVGRWTKLRLAARGWWAATRSGGGMNA